MRTLLLTAFEPFDGDTINPSWELICTFDGMQICDFTIKTACLPVVFGNNIGESVGVLQAAIAVSNPHAVIAFGQAGGRAAVSFERVAINLDDASIADNAGNQPTDVPIYHRAPNAYFSTLPVKAMARTLNNSGILAEISYSAGTFVCNHVFYALQHLASGVNHQIRQSGFVHIPYLPKQAQNRQKNGRAAPSMDLPTLKRALRLMIETLAAQDKDIALVCGSIC